jgi:hypothetical protein
MERIKNKKVSLNPIRAQSIKVRESEFQGLAIKNAITCQREAHLSYSFIPTISIPCEHRSSNTHAQVALNIQEKVPGFHRIDIINSLGILSSIHTNRIPSPIHNHILFKSSKTDCENIHQRFEKNNSHT